MPLAIFRIRLCGMRYIMDLFKFDPAEQIIMVHPLGIPDLDPLLFDPDPDPGPPSFLK
jgi:hypothetical protein